MRVIFCSFMILFLWSISFSSASGKESQKLVIENFKNIDRYEGFALDKSHVKLGECSAKWTHMDEISQVSSEKIRHDWTGYNFCKIWIYNEKKLDSAFMIILRSENEATEGMDYYSFRIPLDYTGWKEFVFPIGEKAHGTRSPLGWDKIQRITFTATGWGNTPNPDATVYIDSIRLAYEPEQPGPRITDDEFFNLLDLDYPGLEKVKSAFLSDDIELAKQEYLNYMRTREKPVWHFDWRDRPKDLSPTDKAVRSTVEGGSEGWDYFSQTITVDWKGWKRFELKKSSFGEARKPIGFDRINYIRFSASGWGHTPDPSLVLHFDDFKLTADDDEGHLISDFEDGEDFRRWDGLTSSSSLSKSGDYSGKWADMHINTSVSIRSIPHNWEKYDALRFWIHSNEATGAQIQLILESDTPNVDSAERVMKHIFKYQGQMGQLEDDIDWTFNPVAQSEPHYTREWTYDLNRFGFWRTLGRAYWDTGNEKYAKEWILQMRDWVEDSPVPRHTTGNRTLRWRTIECGIRTAGSWMDTYYYFLGSPSLDADSHLMFIKSFVEHARHLRRFLLEHENASGNWRTMECNGLAHIGIMFPEFEDARLWRETAFDRLDLELTRQVYPDGAQKELTTGYHQVSLRNFLQAAKIAELNDREPPSKYMNKLEEMYEYDLLAMMPNGRLPPLNDAGMSNVTGYLSDGAHRFGRKDFEFGATLGGRGEKPEHNSIAFPYAGQYVMRSGWDKNARYLMFDAGPFGTGHQHEDKLNVFVYAYGRVLVTEPGNYKYDSSKWRRHVLSTPAHNTILVDNMGQHRRGLRETYAVSEPQTGNWYTTKHLDLAVETYSSGYGADRDVSVTHERKVIFVKPDYYVLIDRLLGTDTGEHKFDLLFHLNAESAETNSETKIVRTTEGNSATEADKSNIALVPLRHDELSVKIIKGQENPVQGWIPSEKRQIPTAIYTQKSSCPATFETLLYPYQGSESPDIEISRISVLQEGKAVQPTEAIALEIWHGKSTDLLFVSHTKQARLYQFGGYRTTAKVALVRLNEEGEKVLAAIDGEVNKTQ